jgi:hypothetical protein
MVVEREEEEEPGGDGPVDAWPLAALMVRLRSMVVLNTACPDRPLLEGRPLPRSTVSMVVDDDVDDDADDDVPNDVTPSSKGVGALGEDGEDGDGAVPLTLTLWWAGEGLG